MIIIPTRNDLRNGAGRRARGAPPRGGEPYRNVYAGFFEVREGRIFRWREYFDPDAIREAFKPA